MKPVDLDRYDAIIFDLGGVVLQLDYQATVGQLSALFGVDVAPIYSQAKQSELFDRYERGEISTQLFHQGLAKSIRAKHAHQDEPRDSQELFAAINQAWSAMLLAIPEENLRLLQELKTKKRTYLLSNTNASHLDAFLRNYQRDHAAAHGNFDDLFHRTYFSHLLGQRKPDPSIFKTVITENGLDESTTLFIDDNWDNVQGAITAGLHAVHHPTNAPLSAYFALGGADHRRAVSI